MDQVAADHLGQAVKESKMNFRQRLQEAYEAGYRSALNEQAPNLPSWSAIVQYIQTQIAQGGAGQPQDGFALSMYDYDGDGTITFNDLTIALSLWGRGVMPASAEDYQAGALIIDDSGLGEPLSPEGQDILDTLSTTINQGNTVAPLNPLDIVMTNIMNQTGAQTSSIYDLMDDDDFNPVMPNTNIVPQQPIAGLGGMG